MKYYDNILSNPNNLWAACDKANLKYCDKYFNKARARVTSNQYCDKHFINMILQPPPIQFD